MKNTTYASRSRTPYLILGAIVVLALAAASYWLYQRNQSSPSQTTTTPDSSKQQVITKSEDSQSTGEGLPENSTSQTSDEVPTSSTSSINILSSTQKDRYIISTAKTSGPGTCVFLYTADGDKPVTEETTVADTVCTSRLPEVRFAKLGTWNLKVTYYSNGEKAEASKDVTIQ